MASTTSIKLPEDLKEKISTLSQGVAQTPHAYMVDAIAQKVARDEKRREFIQSALDSRAETKRTGLVYDGDEVLKYFRDRVAGKKVKRPKPIRLARAKR
jgi:predicted transcriptional regulator